MSQVYVFDGGTEDINNETALPRREYTAPAMRTYANFSKMYVSFWICKVMAQHKESLECDPLNPIYRLTIHSQK